MYLPGLGQGQMAGCCEHGNDPSGCIKILGCLVKSIHSIIGIRAFSSLVYENHYLCLYIQNHKTVLFDVLLLTCLAVLVSA
jgi:hypothetical protein